MYEKQIGNIKKTTKSEAKDTKLSVQDEIKAILPHTNIDIGRMPTTDGARKSYAFGCAAKGFSKNVTIPQSALNKMENDPSFKQKVINSLQKEFSQKIPNIPGMKVLAHGAIVHEDGSVGGWIVGGPDGSQDDIGSSNKQRRIEGNEEANRMELLERKYFEQTWLKQKSQKEHVQTTFNQNRSIAQTVFKQKTGNVENAKSAYEKMLISYKQ